MVLAVTVFIWPGRGVGGKARGVSDSHLLEMIPDEYDRTSSSGDGMVVR